VNPKPLRVGKVTIGGKCPVFILGPCVIESEKFVWRMAKKIAEICADEDIDFIFKASYDKGNRTSVRSFRGIGVREGCEILSAIGRDLKIPVTADNHCRRKPGSLEKRSTCCKSRRFSAGKPIYYVPLRKRIVRSMLRRVNFAPGMRNIAEKLVAFGNENSVSPSAAPPLVTTISSPICARFIGFARQDIASFLMQRIPCNGRAGQVM
jgi:2-dehydro-3-deoxyphosphooctonate aldolase (KDO 8-P synthase)